MKISANSNNSWKISLKLWGTGSPRREFLYVDDLADAVVFLMNHYNAKANQTENSDLDVAVILRRFSGDRFLTRLKLMKYCRNFNEVIEPHPFLNSEFNDANPFASEILRTGITVYS